MDSILGLGSFEPAFQYDHMKILEGVERMQYLHWISQSSMHGDALWFWTVKGIAALPSAVPAKMHCRRTVSKTYRLMDEHSAEALVADLEAVGWLNPGDLNGKNIQLCFVLPDAFAQMAVRGGLEKIAIPSPIADTEFKTPRWFQKMLSPALLQQFEATQDDRALDHPEKRIFGVTEAECLSQDLRKILVGDLPVSSMIPWVTKLQHLADSLEPGVGLKLRQCKQRNKSMIQMLIFTELLKTPTS